MWVPFVLYAMTIDHPDDPLALAWQDNRRRVLDVCYRMLGTLSDAEDATQETFIRLARADLGAIDDVTAWLVAVAGRVCLDRLRADTVRRRYVGPWLPSPLVESLTVEPDPADRVTLDDTVRIALLSVLEQLSPAERAVFVLHDVFGLTFEQVAGSVGRTPQACRKLASRARSTIRRDAEPRFTVTPTAARRVAERFAAACATGNLDPLVAVLDPDVVGEFDSGGYFVGAPTGPLAGIATVANTLVAAFAGTGATFTVRDVNAQPGVVVSLTGRIVTVIGLETDGARVRAIRAIGNPEKLAHLNDVRPPHPA